MRISLLFLIAYGISRTQEVRSRSQALAPFKLCDQSGFGSIKIPDEQNFPSLFLLSPVEQIRRVYLLVFENFPKA
jgi:hypothetical protein